MNFLKISFLNLSTFSLRVDSPSLQKHPHIPLHPSNILILFADFLRSWRYFFSQFSFAELEFPYINNIFT